MREIKFRAWHSGHPADGKKRKGTMLYWWAEKPGTPYYVEGMKRPFNLDAYLYGKEEHTVMRYAGFQDNLGEDVYEGDIVKYFYEGKEQTERYVVTDEYESNNLTVAEIFEGEYDPDDGLFLSNIRGNCEIIGNIYENKELLNENISNK